jgi:tetratricopeptide (TPR) repeat protein
MNKFIFVIILMATIPAYAEQNSQQDYINQGFDYINSGDYHKAREAFETAIKINPDNADAYFGLGVSYLKLGDNKVVTIPQLVQEAIYFFKKALILGANNSEIHYYLGLSYLALNDKETAIEEYDILEDINSDLADQLLVKITDYKKPQEYGKTGETVSPLHEDKKKSEQPQTPLKRPGPTCRSCGTQDSKD